MDKIFFEQCDDVPRFSCTCCKNCRSKMGISLCKYKNRGCCWYFPKFELVDIHRMSKSIEGLNILYKIKNNSNTIIYHYYIHAKGYFDKKGYEDYIIKNKNNLDQNKDYTAYFRACPFVKDNYGCTIPPKFRTYICNFFVCDYVLKNCMNEYMSYKKEVDNYTRWRLWENESLELMLKNDYSKNLINNFDDTIKILQQIPFDNYEFPELKPILFITDNKKGA